jgi:hypothetical protein
MCFPGEGTVPAASSASAAEAFAPVRWMTLAIIVRSRAANWFPNEMTEQCPTAFVEELQTQTPAGGRNDAAFL